MAKPLEQKRADFYRIAQRRVSVVVDGLQALRHLASTDSYEWTPEQQDKIFAAIQTEVDDLRSRFEAAKSNGSGEKTKKQLSFRL